VTVSVLAKMTNIADELKKFDGIPREDMFNVLLTVISQCAECFHTPSAFITDQHLPVCAVHLQVIVDMDIEWESKAQNVCRSTE